MDEKKNLIAVASSDGIVVNQHFGRAKVFHIYDFTDEENITKIEERNVTPVCNMGEHDEDKLTENIKALSDCKYLLVCKIGDGARLRAESFGIESYEIPGIITESIKRLLQYVKIQDLFF